MRPVEGHLRRTGIALPCAKRNGCRGVGQRPGAGEAAQWLRLRCRGVVGIVAGCLRVGIGRNQRRVNSQCRPQARKGAALCGIAPLRRLIAFGRPGTEHRDQMQPPLRTRATDVEEASPLRSVLGRVQRLQVLVHRIRRAQRTFARPQRGEQQRLAVAVLALLPAQRGFVAASGRAVESRQDHRIEFETLGPVHRHHLHAGCRLRIGLREQPFRGGGKGIPVRHVAAALMPARAARRTVPRQRRRSVRRRTPVHPARATPYAARCASDVRPRCCERIAQRGAQPPDARPAVGRKACDDVAVGDGIEYRPPVRLCRDDEQVGQQQAAPRRPQQREAGQTVGGLRQYAHQRREVARGEALRQRLEIDGSVIDAFPAQRRQDEVQVAPHLDQDRDVVRPRGLRLADPARRPARPPRRD